MRIAQPFEACHYPHLPEGTLKETHRRGFEALRDSGRLRCPDPACNTVRFTPRNVRGVEAAKTRRGRVGAGPKGRDTLAQPNGLGLEFGFRLDELYAGFIFLLLNLVI